MTISMVDDAVEIDVVRNVAALGRGAQQVDAATCCTSASKPPMMRAISGLRRLSAMISVQSPTCSAVRSTKWWLRQPASTAKKSVAIVGAGELLRRPRRGRARRCRR